PARGLGRKAAGGPGGGAAVVAVPAPSDQRLLWLDTLLEAPRKAPEFDGKASGQLDGPLWSLKTQLQVEAAPPTADIGGAERWQTEEALNVPVAGPVYLIGQFNAGYNTWTGQQMTMTGRTGVGCKFRPLPGGEVVLCGARVLNYAEDPLRPQRVPTEKSQLVLELQANYALFGRVERVSRGPAAPALDPREHNRLNQDVRFAIPLGKAGQIRLGAKHSWEEQPVPKPWTDGMQLYLGVGLKR